MSRQLALALALDAPAPRPRALRVAPPPPLPRALRTALATVYADSPDGRAYAELAAFWRRHGERGAVLPQPLRKYARRLGLGHLGDGRR